MLVFLLRIDAPSALHGKQTIFLLSLPSSDPLPLHRSPSSKRTVSIDETQVYFINEEEREEGSSVGRRRRRSLPEKRRRRKNELSGRPAEKKEESARRLDGRARLSYYEHDASEDPPGGSYLQVLDSEAVLKGRKTTNKREGVLEGRESSVGPARNMYCMPNTVGP